MFDIGRDNKMKQIHLKETDSRILRELKKDCRRSYRSLARAVGISPAALIERIRKMEQSGIIRGYTARIDHDMLGFEFVSLVQISIARGSSLLEVQKKIAKLQGVAAVYDVTGQYDSVAILKCKSRQELSALIKRILNVPNVEKTNTSMVLNVVKEMDEFSGL